jgi:hypothetical protein
MAILFDSLASRCTQIPKTTAWIPNVYFSTLAAFCAFDKIVNKQIDKQIISLVVILVSISFSNCLPLKSSPKKT